MNPFIHTRFAWLLIAGGMPLCNAAVVQVLPGSNNAPILQLTLSIGGSDVVQNAEASAVTSSGSSAVNVKSVRISDGGPVDLTFFNTEGAKVVAVNPEQSGISSIGVFDNGAVTTSNGAGGLSAYAGAVAGTTLDTDLNNYNFRDNLSPGPTTVGVGDYDLLFQRALNPDDYIMVSERWGNAFFRVTALMADGTPYATANTLHLGLNDGIIFSPTGYQAYDWNTGFAPANVASQAHALTIFSVKEFFEGSGINASAVYGLRIDNDGEADIKIVGASASPFSDNPENPLVVPEPSSLLMAVLGGICFLRRRNRA